MENLDFHTFKSIESGMFKHSYFFTMSFGNFIFFPHQWDKRSFDFLYSKGGAWKIFYTKESQISQFSKKIFDKFGVYGIIPNGKQDQLFSQQLPLEIYEKQFFDKYVAAIPYGDHKALYTIHRNGRDLLLMDDSVILNGGEWILNKSHLTPQEHKKLIEELSKLKVDYVLFQSSSSELSYQALTEAIWKLKLSQISI